MARQQHEFQFKASEISKAAGSEAAYHEQRAEYWQQEMEKSFKVVESTAKIAIKKQPVTGGWRMDVDVDYGDGKAYRRLQEAVNKVEKHRREADEFRTDEKVYGTQGERIYDLSTADVHHFRLGGGVRED